MSTRTPTPPKQPTPAGAAPGTEDYSGVFGFFRQYQKIILYTAGLFALITFSITGAMTGFFANIFGARGLLPTIEVGGRTVELTQEDYDYGLVLSQGRYAPVLVLPNVDVGDGNEGDLQDMYAILRRAAIADGLEVSDLEVDRAIDFAVQAMQAEARSQGRTAADVTPTQLALQSRLGSLAHYRSVVKEAMRIGNYIRLQALVADGSDAALMADLLDGKEKVTLQVASLDGKAIEEQIRQANEVTDEQLRTFLEQMSEADRNLHQVYDTNRVSLEVGALRLDQFDPTQWTAQLDGFEPGEELLQRLYEEDKARRFQVDVEQWFRDGNVGPPAEHHPFGAESVQARLRLLAQAEQVGTKLLQQLRDERAKALEAPNEALRQANEARGLAQQALDEANLKLQENPEDQALKDAKAAAEAELASKQAAADAADQVLKQARQDYDFAAAFRAATEGKAGAVVLSVPGPSNAEELGELPELGHWQNPYLAVNVAAVGDLGASVARADAGVFLFKVTELVQRPLKPFEKVKDSLRDVWFVDQAKQQTTAKKEAFEQALLRLAKERIPEQVQEIEGKRQGRIDERVAAWEQDLQARIAKAETRLRAERAGSRAHQEWQQRLAELQAELAGKEAKVTEITELVTKEIDGEVKAAATRQYGEVLAAAAQEAGFTVTEVGPHRRDLASQPRFTYRFDDTVEFLFQGGRIAGLKQGEATDLLEDSTNRRWYLAVCTRVEPLTADEITRREFEQSKRLGMRTFREQRVEQALRQSFDLAALKTRYHFKSRQTESTLQPVNPPRQAGTEPKGKPK